MLNLSNKATGDELTAEEWDNHSKELENVVTSVGFTLSNNENDLTKAIDIFAKSNVYDTTNSGNDYTIVDRGLNVEELKSGMIIFVRFNQANTDTPTLSIAGTTVNVKNSNGDLLTGMRFKSGEILGLYYNGTDFISTKYLYKYINNDQNGFFNFYSDNNGIISNYIEWNDDYLTNPTHKLLIVRGNIVNNILFAQILLFTEGDLKDNNSTNATDIKIDLGSFFNDNFGYDLKLANYQTGTGVITAEDTSKLHLYASCPLMYDTWKNGSSNSNKIVTNLGARGWKWDTSNSTQYNKLRFYFQVNVKLEDI
jgi:hypothetical protein